MSTLAADRFSLRLWALVLIPPAVWGAQLTLAWLFAEQLCRHGSSSASARAAVIVIGAVAFVIAVASLVLSWRTWRAFSAGDEHVLEATDRSRYLALLGLCVSAVSVLAVVLAWAPSVFFSNACGAIR